MVPALTDAQQQQFELLGDDCVALMSGTITLQGDVLNVGIAVLVAPQDDGSFVLIPQAIMLYDELTTRLNLRNSDGEPTHHVI